MNLPLKTFHLKVGLSGMENLSNELKKRSYYNDFTRRFAHYYDVYHTNRDKIDHIIINSLQKGFTYDRVLSQLDLVWKDCTLREQHYRTEEDVPLSTASEYFELYLRNVLRKILVFEEFERVFAPL